MMTNYQKIILNKLLDKYENSVLSKNGSQLNLKIKIRITTLFPKYFNSDFFQAKKDIDETIQELLEQDFIFVTYDHEDIDDIYLNIDETIIKKIYKSMNRTYQKDNVSSALDYLETIQTSEQWICDFILDMKLKLQDYKGISSYLNINDFKEVKDIFKVLLNLKNEKEISYRKYSIKVLNDSKRFEEINHKVERIIQDYANIEFDTKEELFGYYNIVKNTSFVYLKGDITIDINGQIINLAKLNSAFAISSDNIQNVTILDIKDHNVITVENLTSFLDLDLNDTLAIYLGGYHNKIRREMLLKIYEYNPSLHYFHFGDIDAGGFYIYLHLLNKTNIPFQTFMMDIRTLLKYKQYCKSLTKNDVKRLHDLKEEISDDVIDYMLENNIKLEQEIIDVSEEELASVYS